MIELTHIGETLIAEMLNSSPEVRKLFSDKLGESLIDGGDIVAVPDVSLTHCKQYAFDEAHRVDVGVLIRGTLQCLPIETKLGADRLSKIEFEKRFLRICGTSHGGSRISGSMISILERNLPVGAGDVIEVLSGGVSYQLTSAWILVVWKKVLVDWTAGEAPSLSSNCKIITIEEIVSAFGTGKDFNELVTKLISADYYRQWFGAGSSSS